MSVLVITNNAPNYYHFFNAMAKRFMLAGEEVVFAVDCNYSRDKSNIDDMSGVVYGFEEFFKNHKFNEEVADQYKDENLSYILLSDFERAEVYGIWRKRQFSNEYQNLLLNALLCYFDDIFSNHEIKSVLYENVSNSFSYVAQLVARVKGVPYLGVIPSRLPGRFEITGDPLSSRYLEEIFVKVLSGQINLASDEKRSVVEYIDSIDSIQPDYMKFNNLSNTGVVGRYAKIEKLKQLSYSARYIFKDSLYAYLVGNPVFTLFRLFFRNFRRSLNCKKVKKLYDVLPSENDSFYLYPLHFHPESSTSILAGNYLDELSVIRNIAFNLPVGCKLYVKDHMSGWGYEHPDFYNAIKRLPNTVLLGPNEPTKALIKKSIGVVTLTSTVGYEALLLGKPVVLFGSVFYDFHKNVHRVENVDRLHSLLLDLYRAPGNKWCDREYNEKFVSSYWYATYPGVLNLLNSKYASASDLDSFFSGITQHLSRLDRLKLEKLK